MAHRHREIHCCSLSSCRFKTWTEKSPKIISVTSDLSGITTLNDSVKNKSQPKVPLDQIEPFVSRVESILLPSPASSPVQQHQPPTSSVLTSNFQRYNVPSPAKSMSCLAPKPLLSLSRQLRRRGESGGILTVVPFHSPPAQPAQPAQPSCV